MYGENLYPLSTNRWADGTIDRHGYRFIESFCLEGTIPVWRFACADAVLKKRVWMKQGANTTYIHYTLRRTTMPFKLTIKAFINYRDYHSTTHGGHWQMKIDPVEHGFSITGYPTAVPFYLLTDKAKALPAHDWYFRYDLAQERYRGLDDREDHLHAATFHVTFDPGESLTLIASIKANPDLNGEIELEFRRAYEQKIIEARSAGRCEEVDGTPDWINHLMLTADWVVTPRIGKPIEVNALWYNALKTMANFARLIGKPYKQYDMMAELAAVGFGRFWNDKSGYCYDVIDGPDGDDPTLRPNQIFAVSLPQGPIMPDQQRGIVDACARSLLTSHGLRSLTPDHPQYKGHYSGDRFQRDGAYHQGTVWRWLIGPFILAYLRVYNDPIQAREILKPMAYQLIAHGVGTLSEIYDGDAPMTPRGCIAQAWAVAEVIRAWLRTESRVSNINSRGVSD